MSTKRKMERAKARHKRNDKPLPINQGVALDVMSMKLPNTLVINVDTEHVYVGNDQVPVNELKPIFTSMSTREEVFNLLTWFAENKNSFDKVVMTKKSKDDSEEKDIPVPQIPRRSGKSAPIGFKIFTNEEFIAELKRTLHIS